MQITIREPGSAITHYIGMLLSLIAAAPLLIKAEISQIPFAISAMGVFILTMILLYAASTIYHSLNVKESILNFFRKLDHMMIFILIAGTYTPVCILALGGNTGMVLLAAVWGIAVAGIFLKLFWINCPKWFSSIIYIAMGWVCVFVLPLLVTKLSAAAFGWLLAGGILYTAGGVIYALKLKGFNQMHKYFGSHEIFHLFVMGGSFCHFVVMYFFII